MPKYTGYEIQPFSHGMSAYGFGLLQQWGYIDYIPSVEVWADMDTVAKRQYVLDTNALIDERLAKWGKPE